MAIDGTPKFQTLAVAELTAELKGSSVTLTAKAAFVDRASGLTHGWTKGEGAIWSQETIARLGALRESMERDLAGLHFNGPALPEQQAEQRELGGLGEHLMDAEQA